MGEEDDGLSNGKAIKEEEMDSEDERTMDEEDQSDNEALSRKIKEEESDEEYLGKKDKKSKKRKAEDDDDDEDYMKKKAKKKKDKKKSKDKEKEKDKGKAKIKKEIKQEDQKSTPKKKKKEEEEEVWRWWDEEPLPDGVKWRTLEHKGPYFPPEYEPMPKNVKFYYNGEAMTLSPAAEEVATFYSKMLEHDYTKKDIFNENFFTDWRKEMTDDERKIIKSLEKCNFKEMG